MNKERGLVMMAQEGGSKRNDSSTEQSRDQKVRFAIKSNIPGNSIVNDKYQEGTAQREAMKYLRESCYHYIECSAANSLTTLMWK